MSKEYFDNVAHQWETMREQFFPQIVREKAYAVASVKPGTTAADIGAGTGFITEGLLHKGVKVIAVDQSEAMLMQMKKRFPHGDVDYRVGTAEGLPIPDDTVDYVFANMYLHHVTSPLDAIKEMTRTLKKGGILVITDLDEHNFEFLRTEQHDTWMGFKREDIRKWFLDAGLENVTIDCTDESCCAQSECGSEYANISIFVASGRRR
jgi:ubiquinone/menaquinone biosynthesis C-methylase UbiE